MKKQLLAATMAAAALGLSGCSDDETLLVTNEPPAVFGNVFALTASDQLISFIGSAPATVLSSQAITGVGSGESLLGIDFRPANGTLYLLTRSGTTGYLYTVNTATAVATRVSTLADDPAAADSGAAYAGLTGNHFGVDFNPVPDRLRVVSDTGSNLRINVDTGGVAVDSALNGGTPNVVASAYTNSFGGGNAATLGTTLYGIDATTDRLVVQNPPNAGTLTDVGTGLGFNGDSTTSFDIAGVTGVAYAALTPTGGTATRIYSVNLTSGVGMVIGTVGGGEPIKGLAIPTPAPALAYATTETNKLLSFTPSAAGTVTTIGTISGLQSMENIVGIDVRPLNGELLALGSTGRIYRLSTTTAAATLVTGTPLTLTGPNWGFDFNPTVDRLRLVSEAEENLRAHPDTGNLAATDTALNPAGDVVAAAYDRNFLGSTLSTLFAIDSGTDALVRQGGVDGNPSPNLGAITSIGALGVDTTTFAAFDIVGGQDGMVLAALNVSPATTSGLYRINLATGAATLVTTIGGGERITGLAVKLASN